MLLFSPFNPVPQYASATDAFGTFDGSHILLSYIVMDSTVPTIYELYTDPIRSVTVEQPYSAGSSEYWYSQ